MNLARAFSKIFHALLAQGFFYKLRHAYFNKSNLLKTLSSPLAQVPPVTPDSHIVVVGLGIAAFSFINGLYRNGFRKVTVISKDDFFGGKCLNFGCMPSEWFYSGTQTTLTEFTESLQKELRSQLKSTGYSFIKGNVQKIEKNKILLEDGTTVFFDRLVLATGNAFVPPPRVKPNCDLEGFWNLNSGRLVILSNGNIAALSLAAVAKEKGLETTVIFESTPPLSNLPAVKYFKREIEKLGVTIISKGHVLEANSGLVRFKLKGLEQKLNYDSLLYLGVPKPILPQIDGKTYSIYDLDLLAGAFSDRPDISVIGDAAGFFSATEAEFQAQAVVKNWLTGERLKICDLDRIPLRLHARSSLALVGAPWTLANQQWSEVDFRNLGWTKLHGDQGKLWYLYNQKTDLIESIHLCHPQASELIAIAGSLMEFNTHDPRWQSCAVHPSAAEIFKVMIEKIHSEFPLKKIKVLEPQDLILLLPPLHELEKNSTLPTWLTRQEYQRGILSLTPHAYFSILYGTKTLLASEGMIIPEIPTPLPLLGTLTVSTLGAIKYQHDDFNKMTTLQFMNRTIRVNVMEGSAQ